MIEDNSLKSRGVTHVMKKKINKIIVFSENMVDGVEI